MKSILNKISWLIAFLIGLIFIFSEGGSILIGIVFATITKLILNKTYIDNVVDDFKKEIFDDIVLKLKEAGVKITKKIEEKVQKETITVSIKNQESQKEDLEEKTPLPIIDNFVNEPILTKETIEKGAEIHSESKEKEAKKSEIKKDSKFVIFLKDFFSENIVAKIGGILLAIGILFLMGLVYSYVGPVTKIILGLFLGFLIYIIGIIIDRKGYSQEAMILLGSGILINYIVILSGKYLIGDGDTGFLSSGITLIFLILNTILSVFTSFVYKSKNLLLFSLVFSYMIPFLIGEKFSNLFIVLYNLILSLGGFIISSYYKNLNRNSSAIIQFIALIGGNILLCTSGFVNSFEFANTMFGFIIINFLSIFLFYKNNFIVEIKGNFLLSYIFLGIIMFFGKSIAGLGGFVFFLVSTIGLFIFNSFLIASSVISSMFFLLFFPLILALGFLVLGDIHSGFIVLPIFLIAFLTSFVFLLSTKLSVVFKNIFFMILAGFLFFGNGFMLFSLGKLDNYTFYSIFVTGITFLLSSFFLSSKKDLSYLYTIGTLGAIAIFSPIINASGEFYIPSALIIIVFFISNILTPYFNKNLIHNDTKNLILGNIFGILFVGFNLYNFGLEYFPGVSLGLSFMFLALIYFFLGFNIFLKIEKAGYDEHKSKMYFVNTLLTIAITLFTISVAIIFSKVEIVIALIWLLESSVILFFASKTNSNNLGIIGNILFAVGVFKFAGLISDKLVIKDLVGIVFIFIVLFFNYIKVIFHSQLKIKFLVRILHAIGLIFIYFYTIFIFDIHDVSMTIIYALLFVGLISFIYSQLKDSLFRNISLGLFVFFLAFHTSVAYINDYYEQYYLNFAITFLASFIVFAHYKIFNFKNIVFLIAFYLYLFVISSIYLYHFTGDFFVLTIYWGILSLFAVHFGIYKNLRNFRLVGIIVLSLTLFKIIFYDIFNSTENSIVRIIAFLLVGGIMIYISSLYKKHNIKIIDDLKIGFKLNLKTKEAQKKEGKLEENKKDTL